jgi:parvulin-like peptidyl-prolyl isomerase
MRAISNNLASLASAATLALGANVCFAQAPATPPPAPATQPAPVNPAKPAAIVNGEPITQADVMSAAKMVTEQRFRTGVPTDAQRHEVFTEVIAMLVDDVLLRQFLAKTGVKVDPAEVDKQFAELKASLGKAKPPRTIEDFYKETGRNEGQIRSSILDMLRWGEYVKTKINENDLKRYYTENKDFFDQVAVRASHILIRISPSATETERAAARQKLLALRAEILTGKIDFGEAAKKNSQCSSAPNGGDIGFFPRKMMVEEAFAKAAFSLKPGEVSDVVQTDAGLHLIKVTERKPGQNSEFDKVKDDVRDFYIEEMRQTLLTQERKNAKITMQP